MATITSISYLFRSAGGVIGISATSAIFQGIVKKVLTEKITGPDAESVSIEKFELDFLPNTYFLLTTFITDHRNCT